MSLSDDHLIAGDDDTWAVPSDPQEETPLTWPVEQSDPDPSRPT